MKRLKISEIKKHNLDVWAFIFRRRKFNKLYTQFLSVFEYQIRRFYFQYLKKARKALRIIRPLIAKKFRKRARKMALRAFRTKKRWRYLPRYKRFKHFIHNDITFSVFMKSTSLDASTFYSKHKLHYIQQKVRKINFLNSPDQYLNRFQLFNIYNLGKKIYLLKLKRRDEGRKFFLNKFIKKNRRVYKNWMYHWSEQKQFLFFYGFFSKKKFFNFIQQHNLKAKNSLFLLLEFTLINFIFRMGFFLTSMEIYKSIKSQRVTVNNRIISNPFFILKVGDNISFIKLYKPFIYNQIIRSLKNGSMLLNIPPYIEVNYTLLAYSIWRTPLPSELPFFYRFPFNPFFRQSIV